MPRPRAALRPELTHAVWLSSGRPATGPTQSRHMYRTSHFVTPIAIRSAAALSENSESLRQLDRPSSGTLVGGLEEWVAAAGTLIEERQKVLARFRSARFKRCWLQRGRVSYQRSGNTIRRNHIALGAEPLESRPAIGIEVRTGGRKPLRVKQTKRRFSSSTFDIARVGEQLNQDGFLSVMDVARLDQWPSDIMVLLCATTYVLTFREPGGSSAGERISTR